MTKKINVIKFSIVVSKEDNEFVAWSPDFDIAALANDPELGIAAQTELAEPAEDTCEDMKRAIGAAGVEVEWDCEP